MFRWIFSSALLIAASLATGAAAQDLTFESDLEAAKKERTLFVAISTPGTPESQQALSAAFNKRFGFDARIEWSSTSIVQSITKLIAEKGRGKASIDVIGTGGISEGVALLNQGLIKPYPWRKVFGSTLPEIGDVSEKTIPELKGSLLWVVDSVGGGSVSVGEARGSQDIAVCPPVPRSIFVGCSSPWPMQASMWPGRMSRSCVVTRYMLW